MKLVFRWMPLWLLAVVLPILILTSLVLYRSDRRVVSPRRGWALSILRASLVASILVLLLDPALVEQSIETETDELLVIVDVSESMTLVDKSADGEAGSRLVRVRTILESDAMARLRRDFRVTWCALDENLRENVHDLLAGASASDLAGPIVDAVLRRPRDSLAGAVLLSDGHHNSPRDPRKAARALHDLGARLFVIGVGPDAAPSDIVLRSIDATGKVFAGDEVDVEVVVENRGIAASRLPVFVHDGEKELARFELEDVPEHGVSRWPLRFQIHEPGRRRIVVRVEAQPGEATAANNETEIWIEVLDARIRILYVDGAPRWEYRYLRNTWERDENIELDVFLVSPPPERELPSDFPRTREELFQYDAIVLGDFPASLFSTEEQQTIVDFIGARSTLR